MNTPDSTPNVTAVDRDGIRYVPLASVVQQLGGTIAWDNTAKKATLSVKGRNAEVDLNDRIVKVDGQEQILQSTPFVQDGHLYVTLDFMDELGITHS